VPGRPMGVAEPTRAARPGSPESRWIPVAMTPGRTALTRTPSCPQLAGEAQREAVHRSLGAGVVDVFVR